MVPNVTKTKRQNNFFCNLLFTFIHFFMYRREQNYIDYTYSKETRIAVCVLLQNKVDQFYYFICLADFVPVK